MLSGHNNSNSSTGIEIDFYSAPARLKSIYQIVKQAVGKVFVKGSLITKISVTPTESAPAAIRATMSLLAS